MIAMSLLSMWSCEQLQKLTSLLIKNYSHTVYVKRLVSSQLWIGKVSRFNPVWSIWDEWVLRVCLHLPLILDGYRGDWLDIYMIPHLVDGQAV